MRERETKTPAPPRTAVHPPAPPAALRHVAERAAAVDCTLFITGETGVGKGCLARWIHAHGPRVTGPFVPVNCGAIPDSLIDSQLFGHARGAFSGATDDHLGLVRAAEGGTLFLDEVSELPLTAQTRLLRLLQEREVQPVGHSRPLLVDVRVIAATNTDLRTLVDRGAFREDLYFRLDVIRVDLEPLRERRDEIRGLVDRFNAEFAALYGQRPLEIDRGAMQMLVHHDWPGNVRQLRTVLERLHVLCGPHRVTPQALREFGQLGGPDQALGGMARLPRTLQQARLEAVHSALAESNGNVSKAASALGVHRSTIYRWLSNTSITRR